MKPLVRQLDHIFASVRDPRPVFDVFATLGFPLAWEVGETPAFTSGGFFLDNLKIEFTYFDGDVFLREGGPLSFTGLAFEPIPLSEAVAELDERGVPHTEMFPIGNFTNCFITDVSPSYYVFLCEYDLANHPWLDPIKNRPSDTIPVRSVADRWKYYRSLLLDDETGLLGAMTAVELKIGTPDIASAAARWRRLLGSEMNGEIGTWRLLAGPTIRLIEHPTDEVVELVIGVKSLENANAFLKRSGALLDSDGHSTSIFPEETFGLPIMLVAAG